MNDNVFDTLLERGLIAQATHEDLIKELLGKESVTFYIGFDATAASLHIGHFLPIILMMHLQKAGHRPIALLGTGTTMVGDPTGRTDMRKMLTPDEINANAENFRKQISKYVDFSSEDKGIIARNGEWLMNLNYIDFLRDVGVHFSVNRMLATEAFKSRMEKGLSFIEFNYMLMQSYDFVVLNEKYNCKVQFGGNDQWANVIAGVELVRKKEGKDVYGMTLPLLLKSDGTKMGKTAGGALWIDPDQLSPYEFFQYFRNVPDDMVVEYFKLLTFVSMDEVREMETWENTARINEAKERLAFEITKIIHGEPEAEKARETARSIFVSGQTDENMPSSALNAEDFTDGSIGVLALLSTIGLTESNAEGRRLVTQGGISADGEKIADPAHSFDMAKFEGEGIVIRKGKKIYHKVVLA